jgi:hypothetical protein
MIHHQINRIPFSHIDFDDQAYALVPPTDGQQDTNLQDSISRVGLLHPPILKEKCKDVYLIISGRKRLFILKTLLKADHCDCLILPRETDEISVYTLLLEALLLKRPITPVEKAVFFERILRLVTLDQAAHKFLPLLGLSPSPYHIERALTLLGLEEPLLASLHQGLLHEKTALELSQLPFKDRWAIFELISQLQLSVGKQQQMLAISRELSRRNRIPISDILSCDEVNNILNHPETNIPQKSSHLLAWLARKRTPRLFDAERKFKEFINDVKLPPGAQLSHTLSFEKDEITLALPFKNESEFLKSWQQIKTILANSRQPQ